MGSKKDNEKEEQSFQSIQESEGKTAVNGVIEDTFQNSQIDTTNLVNINKANPEIADQSESDLGNKQYNDSFPPLPADSGNNNEAGDSDIDDNLPPPPLEDLYPDGNDLPHLSTENEGLSSSTYIPERKIDEETSEHDGANDEEALSQATSKGYVGLISPTGFSSSKEKTVPKQKMKKNKIEEEGNKKISKIRSQRFWRRKKKKILKNRGQRFWKKKKKKKKKK